ncbi:hypothetical protein AVEN_154644-1 [Araneus ventricosus]|uniref:Uncharacterized protein n=1 Tax=Araneus ventricosus TaxID=182803 RepID=A0A4Y2JL80_ARAVE|nr:hypothetical protein AVEN_154644-1 [Araneus ventricosus]
MKKNIIHEKVYIIERPRIVCDVSSILPFTRVIKTLFQAGLDYRLLFKSKNSPNESKWKLRSSEAFILSFLLFNLTDKEGFLKGFWEQQKELGLIPRCFLPKNKKRLLRVAQMNRESPDESEKKMIQDPLILYYFP